jgi:hypothetical protein
MNFGNFKKFEENSLWVHTQCLTNRLEKCVAEIATQKKAACVNSPATRLIPSK